MRGHLDECMSFACVLMVLIKFKKTRLTRIKRLLQF